MWPEGLSKMNFLTESNLPFRASQRLSAINVSEILKISSLTSEMKRQGRDVIDLSVGEPDFSTPDHIKEAAARAIRNEATKYTALDGTIELKVAIQEKFRRENNISYGLNEVTVSAGAKQILFNALMASLNIGDEVIIPTPAWVATMFERIPIAPVLPVRDHRAFGTYRLPSLATGTACRSVFLLRNVWPE